MKTTIAIILLVLCVTFAFGQSKKSDKEEIQNVIQLFMNSIVKKDSAVFYRLFHEDPITWIGVIKEKSQSKILEQNPKRTKNYFNDTYRAFIKYIKEKEKSEEKFDNIQIINDDAVASVTFDYSFWSNNKMTNWGKESWHLIKTDSKWKIVSVIFSMELTKYFDQPPLNERIKRTSR